MGRDVALVCHCGELRGQVRDLSPQAGFRVVCDCDDCQAFARHLGAPGKILDGAGGTEIFQTSPARFSFERGELASMRLSGA